MQNVSIGGFPHLWDTHSDISRQLGDMQFMGFTVFIVLKQLSQQL